MKVSRIGLIFINLVAIEGKMIVPFVDNTITSILMCNDNDENIELIEEVMDISYSKNIWLNHWNCFEDPIPKISNGLMILDGIKPKTFKDILNREDIQRSLSSNYWLVISNPETLQIMEYFDQRHLMISLSARIFFVKQSSVLGHYATQVQGTGSYEVVTKDLGAVDKIEMKQILKIIDENQDFNGLSMSANFASYPPFCIVDEMGNPTGLLYDVLKIVSEELNLTLEITPPSPQNKDIWFKKNGNGSVIGMLAEVQRGQVDTSIAGFQQIFERFEYVDFTQGIFKNTDALIIKTPVKSDQISYFTEFSPITWITTFGFIVLLIATLTIGIFLLLLFKIEGKDHYTGKLKYSFVTSVDMCLRTIVNIAPENQMTSLTYKMILMTTMMFGFIVFRHYEALLATTLIVESDNMPYKSWNDVLQSGRKVLVWEESDSELKFKVTPEGSMLRQIYDQQIGYLNDVGYQGSIAGVVNDEYVIFESLKAYELYPEFPCLLSAADSVEFKKENFISYPMAKESPFTRSVMETVERLRQHGILDHIWKNYLPLIDHQKCKEPKVSLGYLQLRFPCGILIFGLLVSMIIALLEKYVFTPHMSPDQIENMKEYDELAVMFPMLFDKELSRHQIRKLKMINFEAKEFLEELLEIDIEHEFMKLD